MVKLVLTIAGLVTAAFLLSTIPVRNQAKIEALEKSKDRGNVSWYAEMAKAKGDREISFPASISRYAVPRDLEEALNYYDVVVAQLVTSKSYADTREIITWYKFRIVEDLSSTSSGCVNCSPSAHLPEDMLPLQNNEFLTAQYGGAIDLDGIRIISHNPRFPPFETDKQYLLFLSLDRANNLGALRMGPYGAFRVDSNHDLKPVNPDLGYGLRDELSNQFEDSIGRLRFESSQGLSQG